MVEFADKLGLERSVLSYKDVSLQPPAQYFLVIDEGMGNRALFTVDRLDVQEFEIAAFRAGATVVRFSPLLPWRLIAASEVYLQDTRTVYEREVVEQKDIHELTSSIRKQLLPETAGPVQERLPGQYM